MNEQDVILKPDQPTDRERAIIEAARLIDCLRELQPSLTEIKDRLYQLSNHCRDAINEIRQAEARANGLQYSPPNEFLGF